MMIILELAVFTGCLEIDAWFAGAFYCHPADGLQIIPSLSEQGVMKYVCVW